MFKNISFLIPYKPDHGIRDINFNWIKTFYQNIYPEAEICVGISNDDLFNRSQAINNAAKQATRDIFVLVDADIFCDPNVIKESIEHIEIGNAPWVIPYKYIKRISEENSRVLVKETPTWPLEITDFELVDTKDYDFDWVGGINVISRRSFLEVGGFDERFLGWGGEDQAFSCAVSTICGPYKRLEHTVNHLWHPVVGYENNPNRQNNLDLGEIYSQAKFDKEKMNNVIRDVKNKYLNETIEPRDQEATTIHVVTVTDDNYAIHLAVMLKSLLKKKKSENPIKIYVMYSNIQRKNKSLLKKVVNKYKAKIRFKKIDTAMYRRLKTFDHVTKENYYLLSISDFFDETIDRVLYLDSDVIVRKDITELWNTDISPFIVGAVEDFSVMETRNSDLLMPAEAKYFNAGVLLINLKKWRDLEIKDKISNFINTHSNKIKYGAQDVLNAVLYNQWFELEAKWNYQTDHIPKLKIKPAIIHYTGENKPWNSDHPLKKYYQRYAKRIFKT
ncbi:glycosyltransferase [Anaerobacillus sp. CMMVII]|uniref:glycosyltransferase n=1 Tax=Anaerobacillus sp. CMMVII TaxID=2755588 RepID=UPI0021B82AE4|nr:glycosyltransferase [Anaerobacillus sp. CMMVII]MCT8137614.1 glycosyltransferase [Anaerobacillus sp. CMMVII]